GVLRNLLRNKDELKWPNFRNETEKEAFFASVPHWLMKLWKREKGHETALKIIRSMNEDRFPVLRVNTLRTDRESLKKLLAEKGIEVSNGELSPDALKTEKGADLKHSALEWNDLYTVQEESSQLVAKILDPAKDSSVLDMCAAPGGKTTHIAQLMDNTGRIVASDMYEHKIELIRQNAERLGITNITAEVKDATEWGKECPESFDHVLLDAPCSGFGVIHRRLDSLLHKEKGDSESLAKLQQQLLDSAYRALKPGGTMVYSTCTLSDAENKNNVQWFLENYRDMKSVPFDNLIAGLTEEEKEDAKNGYLELLPYVHHTDGFFIAKFVKDKK
ncbi:MAG: 16S rRNA (cytosine(967)-C(5))-methyltransferase RsmB, partial [Firmicutes bacterium]|nr:16S rRNA (cytosine(967)-C(5))-methyltransferase RsmB [Bacillota bacterium]